MQIAQNFQLPGSNNQPQDVPLPSGIPGSLGGGLDTTGINSIQLIFNLLFMAAGTIAIIVMILSGIQWITSAGDPGKVAAARARLIYAVVGIVVVVLAFFMVQVVYTVLIGQATPNPGHP